MLSIRKFGRDILCTCNPPVLRRTLETEIVEYSNAVQNRPDEVSKDVKIEKHLNGTQFSFSLFPPPFLFCYTIQSSDSEILLESFSDEDDGDISSESSALLLNAIKRGHNKASNSATTSEVEDEENSNNSSSSHIGSARNSHHHHHLAAAATTTSDKCQEDVAAATEATTADDSDEQKSGNCSNSSSSNTNYENAAEIRKLLRRKDELERKQKMQEKYNQRLQVSLFLLRTLIYTYFSFLI